MLKMGRQLIAFLLCVMSGSGMTVCASQECCKDLSGGVDSVTVLFGVMRGNEWHKIVLTGDSAVVKHYVINPDCKTDSTLEYPLCFLGDDCLRSQQVIENDSVRGELCRMISVLYLSDVPNPGIVKTKMVLDGTERVLREPHPYFKTQVAVYRKSERTTTDVYCEDYFFGNNRTRYDKYYLTVKPEFIEFFNLLKSVVRENSHPLRISSFGTICNYGTPPPEND